MSQSYWCFFRKVQSGVCAFWNSCKPTQWVKHLPTDPLRSNFPFVRTPRQMGKRLLLLDFQRSCWKHVGTVWNRKSSDSHIVVRSWMPRILSGIAFIAKSLSSNSGVMRDRDGLFTHYQRYFVYITFAIRANLPYLKSFSSMSQPACIERRLKKHTHFHFLLGLPHKDLLSLLGSTNPCGSTLFKWNLFFCWQNHPIWLLEHIFPDVFFSTTNQLLLDPKLSFFKPIEMNPRNESQEVSTKNHIQSSTSKVFSTLN